MKRYPYSLLLIALILICLSKSNAQPGWQWGINSSNTGKKYCDVFGPTVTDRAGNVYTALIQEGADSITFGTHTVYNPGNPNQLVVVKADSAGNYMWAAGTHDATNAEPMSIATDAYGDLYVLGYYSGDSCSIGTTTLYNSTTLQMFFLVKFSYAGSVIWAKNIAVGMFGTMGIDGSNNVYLSGVFVKPSITLGTITLNNVNTSGYVGDIFLAKLDPTGNVVWAKSFGGKGAEFNYPNPAGGGFPMSVTAGGNIYLSGQSNSDTMWIGSSVITADPVDGVSGMKISFMTAFDNNGNNLWAKKIDRHIGINALCNDLAGNIYATGTTDSVASAGVFTLPCAGRTDVFIAKYTAAGNYVWAKATGGLAGEGGWAVAADKCGKLWVTGQTGIHENITFDGHTLTPDPWAEDPLFIVEYDTAGNYLNSLLLPTGGDDICGIATDNRGNFFIGGDYQLNGTLSSLPFGRDTLYMQGSDEYFFIAKYKYDSGECYQVEGGNDPLHIIPATESFNDIILFPNPVSGTLNITSAQKINNVLISNLLGKTLFSNTYDLDNIQINTADLPAGMYLIKINNTVRKFVKE